MGKKCDLSDFDHGMIVGARQGGLSISETADLLGFSRTTVSRVCREWCEKKKHPVSSSSAGQKCLVNERGQRRRARLVKADRKVTVMQITTHYNSGMQKSISEHTTQTSKWIGYSQPIRGNQSKTGVKKCRGQHKVRVYCLFCCLIVDLKQIGWPSQAQQPE